jgi:hypothetical protein
MENQDNEERRIDVWWRGDATSRLMLLLAYLTTRDEKWHEAKIRVLAVNYSDQSEENLVDLVNLIAEARIDAEPVLVDISDESQLINYSSETSLTFMPFDLQGNEPRDIFGQPVSNIIEKFGVLSLVQAGSDVDLDAEPEDGEAGVLAGVLDNLERATARMQKAHKAAAEAAEHAKKEMEDIEIAGGVLDAELLKKLKKALQARDKSDQAAKKYIREQTKVLDASEQAKKHGALVEKTNKEPGDSRD